MLAAFMRISLGLQLTIGLVLGLYSASGEDGGFDKATMGKQIFLDTGLSYPPGLACLSCHRPEAAFADPRPVSSGAAEGRKGIRNAPSLMYAALIPGIAFEDIFLGDGTELYAWEGGLFYDGSAQDQFEQVQRPFFDENEMNLPDEASFASRLRAAAYADDVRGLVGDQVWKDDSRLSYQAYRALVEFLKQPFFRPFDARIDDYLEGNVHALTEAEKRGLTVFKEDGKCADCHFLVANSWEKPLLSDYGYDNLGVPSRGAKDPGLGGRTNNADELGQFRAPSLRNVSLTAPYMHNGSIETLQDVMEFYNKRDVEPERWGPTDYPATVNHDDMGDLKLTEQQVSDLVVLMEAFTDRSLLDMKQGEVFPKVPDGVPSTEEKRLYFPDWTHRLHPTFHSDSLKVD